MQRQGLVNQIANQLRYLTVQEMCDLMIAIIYELQFRDDMHRVNADGEIVPEQVPSGDMSESEETTD